MGNYTHGASARQQRRQPTAAHYSSHIAITPVVKLVHYFPCIHGGAAHLP